MAPNPHADGLDTCSARLLTSAADTCTEAQRLIESDRNNLSLEGLSQLWQGNMWQIHDELPQGETEQPYHQRTMILETLVAKTEPMAMLDSAGIACCVIKGDKYGQLSQGEDNISVSCIQDGWEVFCVADGHGGSDGAGPWVAAHSTQSLPYYLASSACRELLTKGDAEAALLHAFELTQEHLVYQSQLEDRSNSLLISGATFTCILRDPEHKGVWVAYLGDSKTVMFSPDSVLQETEDHKANVAAELKRIEAAGCEVRTQEFDDGFVSSRIYVKGTDYPGIMMTRCFGDQCVKENGVIARPEILHWEGRNGALSTAADVNERYVLVASDGIWEFMDTQTVHAVVSNHLREGNSLQSACEHLVNVAKMRWKDNEEEYCDDISVIVLPLAGKTLASVRPVQEATSCFSGMCCVVS